MTRSTLSSRAGNSSGSRDLIRDARIADLRLRPHDALRQRRSRAQEGLRDLLGREPADFAQRECDLGVGRERRMAAGEDEAQPIVGDTFVVERLGIVRDRLDFVGPSSIESNRERRRMPSMALKRPADTSQARGFAGTPSRRPLLERRPERVVQCFLGKIEIAKQADQCREDTARFRAIDGFRFLAHVLDRGFVHASGGR